MNPRYAINVCRFSRPVLSTTQPSLHKLLLKLSLIPMMLIFSLAFIFSKDEDLIKAWRCPTLTWGSPTLPSALFCFTSEFGMESGGSKTLWPPSKFFNSESCFFNSRSYTFNVLSLSPSKPLGCCMVKPHGQLVQVSSTPHNAYTPCLSTS